MTVVQRTPDVGVGIRLQRLAPAGLDLPALPDPDPGPGPGPGCGCDVDGVAWVVQPQYRSEGDNGWWDVPIPSARVALGVAEDGEPIFDLDTVQPPTFIGFSVPIYFGSNTAPSITVVAVAVGLNTRGVMWSVERSGSSEMPVDIDITGPIGLLTINALPAPDASPRVGYEDFTLTARCGEDVVGALQLQVVIQGW